MIYVIYMNLLAKGRDLLSV